MLLTSPTTGSAVARQVPESAASAALAVPAANCTGRAIRDRPDDVDGYYKIHAVYAVPSDQLDRALDTDGTIARSINAMNTWLAGQTGGSQFRLDTCGGLLDVTFLPIPLTDAACTASACYPGVASRAGLNDSKKLYAVFYEGKYEILGICAGGWDVPWRPVTVLGCGGGAIGTSDTAQWMDLVIVHEILHTLVSRKDSSPDCMPHAYNNHVNDDPHDLMYQGSDGSGGLGPWVLDAAHDDYYRPQSTEPAPTPGQIQPRPCMNFANSVFLDPLPTKREYPYWFSYPVQARLDDRDPSLRYSPGWGRHTGGSAYKGTITSSSRTGATLRFTFTGRGFRVISPKGPTQGVAMIEVDGVRSRFGTYFAEALGPSVVAWRIFDRVGKHSVTITVLGTKGHPLIKIDEIRILADVSPI